MTKISNRVIYTPIGAVLGVAVIVFAINYLPQVSERQQSSRSSKQKNAATSSAEHSAVNGVVLEEKYNNEKYNFSISYPSAWNLTEKPKASGSLLMLEFEKSKESPKEEFSARVSCFADDPLQYAREFKSREFKNTESVVIDGVSTKLYLEQSRGLETLNFYLPLVKEKEHSKYSEHKRCGMYFSSFGELSAEKRSIMTSVEFPDGFEEFVDNVERKFLIDPPVKG